MQLEVTVPEDHMGKVLADLTSQRRALIQEVGQGTHGLEKVLTAMSPLAGLMVCCDAIHTYRLWFDGLLLVVL